jgi:hypothetical protein
MQSPHKILDFAMVGLFLSRKLLPGLENPAAIQKSITGPYR